MSDVVLTLGTAVVDIVLDGERVPIRIGENTELAAREADRAGTLADLAEAWAEGTEPGGPGTKSAQEHAQDAEGFSDAAAAIEGNVSAAITAAETSLALTTTIGRTTTPVTGSNNAAGTYAMADPVPRSGTITSIRIFGMTGGTMKVRRFTKAGDIFTQVGSDSNITVAAGLATHTVAIAVTAGEYIGFYAAANVFAQNSSATADGLGWYFIGSDQTSFTDTTASTTGWLQVGFDITYYAVPAADQQTNDRVVGDVEAAFVETVTVGRPVASPPATGVNAGANTYVFATPLERASKLKTVRLFSMVEGPVRIRRFTKSGDDFTQAGSDVRVVARVGLNTFNLIDRMEFAAGEYIGFAPSPAGAIAANTATGDSGGYYNGSGNVTTFNDPSITTATRLEIGFDFDVLRTTADEIETLDTTVGEHTVSLGLIDSDLAQTETLTIGRAVTPVTGTGTNKAFVFANPVQRDAEIRTIRLFALATGSLIVKRLSKSGTDFTVVENFATITIGSTGELTLTAGADFTAMAVREGDYLGYYANTAVAIITGVGDSGGYWAPAGTGNQNGTFAATLNTSNQLQIGFDLVRTFYGSGTSQTNANLVARSGLILPFQLGYRNCNGQSNMEGPTAGDDLTTAQTDNNLAFAYNASNPVSTVTLTVANTESSGSGEWPGLGAAEYSWDLFIEENGIASGVADFQTITTNNGKGAQAIAYFLDGHVSNNFTKVISQATATKNIGDQQGKTAGWLSTLWVQGEAYTAGYEDDLIALAEDYDVQGRAATGQTQRIPLITYQVCSFNTGVEESRPSSLAQLAASRRSPLIHCAGPIYHLPYDDYHHLSAEGLRELGAMLALAEKRVVFDRKPWEPLEFRQYALVGTTILDLFFNAPEIVIDTTTVPAQPYYGFYPYDAGGMIIAEADVTVSIVNRNRLRFELSTGTWAEGCSIKTGNVSAVGMSPFVGAATNIRDRMGEGLPEFYGSQMHRWAVIDDLVL
jgi:hypothetical protein